MNEKLLSLMILINIGAITVNDLRQILALKPIKEGNKALTKDSLKKYRELLKKENYFLPVPNYVGKMIDLEFMSSNQEMLE